MKGSDIVFGHIDGLHYKCNKTTCGRSYIDSLE